jgi:hypothetical protein
MILQHLASLSFSFSFCEIRNLPTVYWFFDIYMCFSSLYPESYKISETLRFIHTSASDRNFVVKSNSHKFTEKYFGNVLNYDWENWFLSKHKECFNRRLSSCKKTDVFKFFHTYFNKYISLIQRLYTKSWLNQSLIGKNHDDSTARNKSRSKWLFHRKC